jgi:DNA (cytosine-5)-methyltransferase 1
MQKHERWNVLDLFSGAGGMSFGFHAHPDFRIIGAVDAQNGKPSSGKGTLECNKTYAANIGIQPMEADIGHLQESVLRQYLLDTSGTDRVDVLISCAPCTGFSRTIRKNLVENDPRNSLVVRTAEFIRWFQPQVLVMENVGELLLGKFNNHFAELSRQLDGLGYAVHAEVHSLDEFGLPQRRKRALVVAAKRPLTLRTMSDLWAGFAVKGEAKTVRRAIGQLRPIAAGERDATDAIHASPAFTPLGLKRLQWIPKDGGSWPDILKRKGGRELLIPSMLWHADEGRVGPYRDVYGRMFWDQPAMTIKRECSHIGNGRYAHPEQDRLCSVREMAILQGFPKNYSFVAGTLGNMYRHIGDAVPPLVSFQVAWLCSWMLTGTRPAMKDIVLPNTHLRPTDIQKTAGRRTKQQLALLDA